MARLVNKSWKYRPQQRVCYRNPNQGQVQADELVVREIPLTYRDVSAVVGDVHLELIPEIIAHMTGITNRVSIVVN